MAEALDAGPPHNLPAELTSFVGRERELAEVVAVLAGTRILTLTGPGGSGKTRLAGRAARAALDRHPDGAWWVDLAPLSGPKLVDAALARAVGVRPLPGEGDIDAVAAFLSDRRALVVLDNCEHLLDECARAAEAVARRCPGVTVLATSRVPLRAAGETDWRVPPLSLPADTEGGVAGSDAVRLFADRAGKVRPGLDVIETDGCAVARICRELDGMPLAIELAAARLRSLSPAQIVRGLSDRFRLLTRGNRTALPRHRTLRASVDWSHDLLPEPERVALRRLGVFAGGFTAESATRVCAGEAIAPEDVPDLVASLVEHSLLQVEDRAGEARYRMLETVREYALERLEAAGETSVTRAAHCDACLDLAERLAPGLLEPQQPAVLDALDAEAANFGQAIEHAAAAAPEAALRLCCALVSWWRLRGLFGPARAALDRALDAAPPGSSVLRARTLWASSYLAAFAGDFAAAALTAERARAEALAAGDRLAEGRAEMVLGKCRLMRDPPPASRESLRGAVELARQTGDDLALMHAAHALAFGHAFCEEHDDARRHLEDVWPVVERTGHREFLANHWAAVGWGEYAAGRPREALEPLERGIRAARGIRDTVTEAGLTAYAACVLSDGGDPEAALERLAPVRGRALAQGAGFLLPWAEVAMARIHAAAGRLDEARALFERLLAGAAGSVRYARTWALTDLAETLRLLGDDQAGTVALRARDSAAELGNPRFGARAGIVLGRLAAAGGEWSEAERLFHEALATLSAPWHRLWLPDSIEALAHVAAGRSGEDDAARALGAARRLRDEAGTVPWRPAQGELDALTARLAGALGEAVLLDRLAEGAAMDGDAAVAWLRRGRGSRRRPPGGWESLTPTELEVVRHAAAGLTNPEIARRMFVSRTTVKAHLAHVYAKLGVRNRADLAREAALRPAGIGHPRAGK